MRANILFDLLLVLADGRYEVSASPELLANEVSLLAGISSRNVNCALAFDITDHLGNAILRRYADHHMHVIWLQAPGLNARFSLAGKFCQHLAQFFSDLTV